MVFRQNVAQILEAYFLCRDDCVTSQSVTDFGHPFDVLITSFASNAKWSAKFPLAETCCVSTVGVCACTRFSVIPRSVLAASRKFYTEETAEEAMAPQFIEKRRITRSQVDPAQCLKQASVLCRCTVRTSRWSWINEKGNNLLRYQCEIECAVYKSVQPDVMTSVKTPFCLRLKGPAEVYANAGLTQQHMNKCTGNLSHP